jgi:hypothetical protein
MPYKRGSELPHAKLDEEDIKSIRSEVKQREKLRDYIHESLTNQALADKYNVHIKTIERIVQFQTWNHVL